MQGNNYPIKEILGIKCKPIPDCEGYWAGIDGKIYSTKKNRPRALKPFFNGNGYYKVGVGKAGVGKNQLVAHLVAFSWLGPRPTKHHQICHANSDKLDNRPCNLHYGKRGSIKDVAEAPINCWLETSNALDDYFKFHGVDSERTGNWDMQDEKST